MFHNRIMVGVLMVIALCASVAAYADTLSYPTPVGRLPDGRLVQRVVVDDRGFLQLPHYIYFIDRADVTTNYDTGGKVNNTVSISAPAEYAARQRQAERNFDK